MPQPTTTYFILPAKSRSFRVPPPEEAPTDFGGLIQSRSHSRGGDAGEVTHTVVTHASAIGAARTVANRPMFVSVAACHR